jgi:predicted RNA-binding Zn-ribbon protein involved in translation (DUF1610 family)
VTHVGISRNVSTSRGCENCGATKIARSYAARKIVVPQKSECKKLTIMRTGDRPAYVKIPGKFRRKKTPVETGA